MKTPSPRSESPTPLPAGHEANAFASQHVRYGWWALLVFLTLGLVLESLHGFKVGSYLNLNNETRRLTWTLAHAHGALLGIVLIVFGLTVRAWPQWNPRHRTLAGRSLNAATLLIPGGFFLGGLFAKGGDPGLGILLVPVGGVLLFIGVLLTGMHAGRAS